MFIQRPTIGRSRSGMRLPACLLAGSVFGFVAVVACTTSTEMAPVPLLADVEGGEVGEEVGGEATPGPLSGPSVFSSPSCRTMLAPDADPARALEFAVAELARVTTELDDTAELDDTTELDETVAGARTADGCAVERRPLCAAIFLLGATDPILGLIGGVGQQELIRLTALHTAVLRHAVTLADRSNHGQLSAALTQLAALGVSADALHDDDAVAALLIARASPDIIDPIAVIEDDCG